MARKALLGLAIMVVMTAVSPKGTHANRPETDCRKVDSPKKVLVGVASWYGPGFHKKPTATGNKFDQNDPRQAACLDPYTHTLKYDNKLTCVEVTNLRNGIKLTVECRDTGSFCEKYERMIDLSKAGSAKLRGGKAGTIEEVLVEPVPCG